jgi:ubiquinone/menaquinone biosynthesis C-methylase UbiE
MVDRLFSDAGLAALYDPMCPRPKREDFDFYLPLVMAAKAVLDVGCGTGALLHEARTAGHSGRLCGLDPGAGMLAQARRRPDIEWVLSDLGSVAWKGEFDLVVMTGHAFQVLIQDQDLRASLAAIRSALTADGRFAFETRNPLVREWEAWTPDHPVVVVGTGGEEVTLTHRVTRAFDGHTLSFTHTFTSPAWDQPQISQSTLRFLDTATLASFLADAGLAVEEQYGDWDRTPVSDTSPEIITIARPA